MKKKIGIFILILTIIAIILIVIMINYKRGKITTGFEEGRSDPIVITDGFIIKYPDNRSNCFAVIRIVEEYMNYLVGEEKGKLLNIIAERYIVDDNITEDNIIEKTKDSTIQYSENYGIIIDNIYLSEESATLQTYFIDILYYNKDNNNKYNTKIMVQIDIANSTYQVIPYQYMHKQGYDNLTIGDNCNTGIETIENKVDNVYNLVPITKDSMAERYFNLFLDYLEYDKEQLYYLLDGDFREKRFGDINNYLTYINQKDLESINIDSYQINDYEDYTQYVCIDNEGNYYIFNETAVMEFTLILDTYTIDLPEFTEKYTSGTEQQKVALNIDKFIQAINAADYKYAYNCLADSFKNNYFKTQEEFETYAKENFYEKNLVTYNTFDIEGDVYTYSVTLTNQETNEGINKTFIMQLGEGTEFVLSFDR